LDKENLLRFSGN